MSSTNLINYLVKENTKIKEYVELMDDLWECLATFNRKCNCDQNNCNKLLFKYLNEKWTQFQDIVNQETLSALNNDKGLPYITVQTDPEVTQITQTVNDTHMTADDMTCGDSNDSTFNMNDDINSEDLDELVLESNDNQTADKEVVNQTADKPKTQLIDRVDNSKDRYKCGQLGCNRSFGLNFGLIQHIKKAHPKCNPFSCNWCSKTYQRSDQLTKHYNKCHLDEHGFHRNEYRKRFKYTKISHNKSNANVMLFKCKYTDCQYKTGLKSRFTRHELIHENKRSFKCGFNDCKYGANTSDGIRQHWYKKHGFKRPKQISN